jgi:aminopeptidase Y
MYRFLYLVALSSLARSTVIQYPLHGSSDPQALISSSKELVSSKALQAHITSKNLLKRAEDLYKIAELGTDEYNHPTRVIGSEGRLQRVTCPSSTDSYVAQDTLQRSITYTPQLQT